MLVSLPLCPLAIYNKPETKMMFRMEQIQINKFWSQCQIKRILSPKGPMWNNSEIMQECQRVIVSGFTHRQVHLDLAGESTLLALTVPGRDPFVWANGWEILLEIFARCIVRALDLLATVIVNVVLPTWPRLVLVWKPWVEWNSPKFNSRHLHSALQLSRRDNVSDNFDRLCVTVEFATNVATAMETNQ
jgi:hypothetical protein